MAEGSIDRRAARCKGLRAHARSPRVSARRPRCTRPRPSQYSCASRRQPTAYRIIEITSSDTSSTSRKIWWKPGPRTGRRRARAIHRKPTRAPLIRQEFAKRSRPRSPARRPSWCSDSSTRGCRKRLPSRSVAHRLMPCKNQPIEIVAQPIDMVRQPMRLNLAPAVGFSRPTPNTPSSHWKMTGTVGKPIKKIAPTAATINSTWLVCQNSSSSAERGTHRQRGERFEKHAGSDYRVFHARTQEHAAQQNHHPFAGHVLSELRNVIRSHAFAELHVLSGADQDVLPEHCRGQGAQQVENARENEPGRLDVPGASASV